MIRAPIGGSDFWDKWVEHSASRTEKMLGALSRASKNPAYDPQYALDASFEHLRLTLERYSRGDPTPELIEHFPGLLNAWELSNRLSDAICAEHKLKTCRDWTFELSNLNHYNWCFWLVGLALALEIPDEHWQRLLLLIGGEGEDVLLDRVIGARQPGRRIGTDLLHHKPYARLLQAIDAPKEHQPHLLRQFVENWYAELARPLKEQLWWYIYGDPVKHPLDRGSYFGRWCIEAAAATKAFALDDSLCLGHEHYPGDLLRPNGPSTHPTRPKPRRGLLAKVFGRKGA